jgi:sRNA-binding carbon storage regulator CsrA
MALVLTAAQNEVIYVGDTPVAVHKVSSPTRFTLEVRGEFLTKRFEVNDTRGTEIMPGVVVSSSDKGDGVLARILFRAPAHIEIFREAIYKERKSGKRVRQGSGS